MPRILNHLDFGSQATGKNIPLPTEAGDIASKEYVDSVAQGLQVKESCRAASTGNITLTSGPSSVDGVTLVNGDRVLVKDQTDATDNGIYEFNGAGSAMTRADDLAAGDSAAASFVFVEEGTVNADSGWVCTSDTGSDTVGTDDLDWSQFSGAGSIVARDGLNKSGNILDIDPGDGLEIAGGASSGGAVRIKLDSSANGGNGPGLTTSAAGLTANVDGTTVAVNASGELEVAAAARKLKYSGFVGDGSNNVLTINHALNSTDVVVYLREATGNLEQVLADIRVVDANNISVHFTPGHTPALNEYRITVLA